MFKKIFLSTATVLVATSLGVGAVHADDADTQSLSGSSSKTLPQAGSNDGVIFLASGAALAGLLVGGYVLKKKVVQTNA